EDGIRDRTVTGVQTCALPICVRPGDASGALHEGHLVLFEQRLDAADEARDDLAAAVDGDAHVEREVLEPDAEFGTAPEQVRDLEIGRASCRERVYVWGGSVAV